MTTETTSGHTHNKLRDGPTYHNIDVVELDAGPHIVSPRSLPASVRLLDGDTDACALDDHRMVGRNHLPGQIAGARRVFGHGNAHDDTSTMCVSGGTRVEGGRDRKV